MRGQRIRERWLYGATDKGKKRGWEGEGESQIGHKRGKETDTGEEREGEMEKIGDSGCENTEEKQIGGDGK